MPRGTAINRLLRELLKIRLFLLIMAIKLEFGEGIESSSERIKSVLGVYWSRQAHFLRVWDKLCFSPNSSIVLLQCMW